MNTYQTNFSSRNSRTRNSPGINMLQRKHISFCVASAIAGLSLVAACHARATEVETNDQPSDIIRSVENESSTDAVANVTVTARKREEFVQDVPLPETVLSGTELARDGAVTLSDFAQKAPNLEVSATNSRQTSVSLRGLGKNSANEAIQSSVGIIVDGVVLTQAGMSWGDYVDLDQVEVLRGPQGTLYGKNTIAGAIKYVTRDIDGPATLTASVTGGNYGEHDEKLNFSTPVIDDHVYFGLALAELQHDGLFGFADSEE